MSRARKSWCAVLVAAVTCSLFSFGSTSMAKPASASGGFPIVHPSETRETILTLDRMLAARGMSAERQALSQALSALWFRTEGRLTSLVVPQRFLPNGQEVSFPSSGTGLASGPVECVEDHALKHINDVISSPYYFLIHYPPYGIFWITGGIQDTIVCLKLFEK